MAPAKKLEPGSQWAHLDRDGDGIVSDEEIATEERMIRLQDLKSDMGYNVFSTMEMSLEEFFSEITIAAGISVSGRGNILI